ncbi:MAG: 6-phosphogluconolactonase [Anaerolineales bacterium]|jgi:6-phosphogluconolactonase
MTQIHIAEDRSSWVQMSAQFIVEAAQRALQDSGRFTIALSGGSTPRPVYQALPELWEQHGLEWQTVHLLWSDERCVPLDHPQSNYRMARQALIDLVDIPHANVHPMRCGDDPTASASDYEGVLRELYPRQDWPTLDLLLLGMGPDGHTASLFPGTRALSEHSRWVVANEVPQLDKMRLTLTFPAINAARKIAFLIAGNEKADMVHQILGDGNGETPVPAQGVHPEEGELHWLLDPEAASRLVEI